MYIHTYTHIYIYIYIYILCVYSMCIPVLSVSGGPEPRRAAAGPGGRGLHSYC